MRRVLLLILFLSLFGFFKAKSTKAYVNCEGPPCTCGCNHQTGSCITCPTPAPTAIPTAAPTSSGKCYDCSTNGDCGSGYHCTNTCCIANTPTSAPPTATLAPTAIPTQVPCDTDGNGVCNTPDPYCEKKPEICPFPDPVPPTVRTKTVTCYTRLTCSIYCSYQSGIPDITLGYCPATIPIPTGCQPYVCYSAPNATYCPNFDPGSTCAAQGGVGKCDNCHGTSCGSCSGEPPTAGPTAPPGATAV